MNHAGLIMLRRYLMRCLRVISRIARLMEDLPLIHISLNELDRKFGK